MRYKGIIFDFNGVLFLDSHLHEKAWMDMSEEFRGFSLSQEEYHTHVHGRPNRQVFEYVLSRQIEEKELKQLAHQKESYYRSLCLQAQSEFHLSTGSIALFEYLIDKNISHAIATASGKENVDFYIDHLHLYKWFDCYHIVYDDGRFADKEG